MNLADAIRHAAKGTSSGPFGEQSAFHDEAYVPSVNAGPTFSEGEAPQPAVEADLSVAAPDSVETKASPASVKPGKATPMRPTEVAVTGATEVPSPTNTMVKIELFLSPEQLSGLFRAVAHNQHSVLTLREAANYLRLPVQTVEQLAIEQEIPGLLIDGKWRFTHGALEDWLGLRHVQERTA